MSSTLLISIRPQFVEKILSGQKVFEFRKSLPAEKVRHLVIYSTSPVQRIVAVAEVAESRSGSPSAIWNQCSKAAGISRANYRQYFTGRSTAHAFHLGRVFKLRNPIQLYALAPGLVAPQSFRWMDDNCIDVLQPHLDESPCSKSRLIFLGGIHGVGKGTLCSKVFPPLGYSWDTASKLIQDAARDVVSDKRGGNIDANQKNFLRNLAISRTQHARFVLDGHFTLINLKGKVEAVPVDVFREIKPDGLVLMTGNPAEIAHRLKARDGKDWDASFLATFQE